MSLGGVDLNLLFVLDALLREQNVTRAAESLHMSQPATSAALGRLRRLLDDDLLVKKGRYLELTPRARALIEPVREVLARIEQSIVQPPQFDPASDSRTFSVMGSDYVGVTLLRPLLGRLTEVGAGLRLDLAPVAMRYVESLQRDEIDIAILPDRILDMEALGDCARVPVIEDRFVGAVWRGHPTAGDRLTADLLERHPYLLYSLGGARSIVEDDLDAAGWTRQVGAIATAFVVMPFLLAGTDFVGVIPEKLALRVADAAELRLLEPDLPLTPLRQSALWHSRRNDDAGHQWLRRQLLVVAEETGLRP